MQIAGDRRAIDTLKAAERHVFANLADQAFSGIFQGWAKSVDFTGQRAHGFNRGWVVLGHQLSGGVTQRQEALVLGDEVGFAVHFNQRALLAFNEGGHNTFCRHAGSRFTSLVTQLNAQNFFCFFHVAISFREGFLALHHGCVGLGAQFANHCSGNSHIFSPLRTEAICQLRYQLQKRGHKPLADKAGRFRRQSRQPLPQTRLRLLSRPLVPRLS